MSYSFLAQYFLENVKTFTWKIKKKNSLQTGILPIIPYEMFPNYWIIGSMTASVYLSRYDK